MLTDDPGTPGDGNWEINTALLSARAAGVTTYESPLVDLNYGVGDHLQLKFEMPRLVERGAGAADSTALGNTLVGVKWRFYDAGQEGWQVSTYPQLQLANLFGHSSSSGTAARSNDFLLPVEVSHIGDLVDFDAEFGRWFGQAPLGDTWIAGVALGHAVWPQVELLAELHVQSSVSGGREELAVNVGMRWNWSDRFSFLVSAGHDLHDSLGPPNSVMTYVGVQSRF